MRTLRAGIIPGPRVAPLRRRAFTLVEMLVAVAAVTLIILGVTRIFSATGQTLRTGRSVSYLNSYAGIIEQQLREDIAAMSRDGFLMIRHELVRSVEVDQGAGRRDRRVDELVFFAEGAFRSKRPPLMLDPATLAPVVAEAPAARIYYGHGLRGEPSSMQYAANVRPGDPIPSGLLQPLGQPDANEFASDWILLRHETLLAGASGVQRARFPAQFAFPLDARLDSDVQYAYQPAAADIFRNLLTVPLSTPVARRDTGANPAPLNFETGVIDIATTSLSEIRSIILDAQNPAVVSRGPFNPNADETGIKFNATAITGAANDPVYMQEWMKLALPADSDPPSRMRMRCELSPPNLFGVVPSSGITAPLGSFQEEVRADQLMLPASNFVPHCTEFMVEWSFGDLERLTGGVTAANAQLEWFGGPRNPAAGDRRALAFGTTGTAGHSTPVPRSGGARSHPASTHPTSPPQLPLLIHGPAGAAARDIVYSFFGYVDPTYIPKADLHPGRASSPPFGPDFDPTKGHVTSEPATIHWPWPKLLRITITLVDPNEPTVERTFQYTFELPNRDGAQ